MDLAKKGDIQQLKGDIASEPKKTHDKVGALTSSVDAAHKKNDTVDNRINNLEKKVKELETNERAPPPWMGPTGALRGNGRFSTTSRTPATSSRHVDEEWRARIIHWRRWAPFGSGEGNNINRAEAEQVQAQILDRGPELYKPRVKFRRPYMKNHSVSAEILAAGPSDAKLISDLINLELQKRPVTVKNVEIKGPSRPAPAAGELSVLSSTPATSRSP